MRRLLFLLGFLVCALSAHAQGVYFPSQVTQSATVAGFPGVLIIPASPIIAFCNAPANAVPCTNKATTYTDATLLTPCSTSTQIVREGTNSCVSTPDAQGNWGVWVASGQYAYTITISGANFGPYYVTTTSNTGWAYLGTPNTWLASQTFNNIAVFNSGYELAANAPIESVEGTFSTTAPGFDICYGDSTAHALECSYNGGNYGPVGRIMNSASTALNTGALGGAGCESTITIGASNATTSSHITWNFATDPSSVAGYGSAPVAAVQIWAWPTNGFVNFRQCSAVAVTPGAISILWSIIQ